MNDLAISDLNTKVAADPRIEDIRLAQALGIDRPRNIRQLIERHRTALERFGDVCCTAQQTSSKGGRPGKTYWLNKKQALFICTKSETANATETTIQMVEVFDAWQSGSLTAEKAGAMHRPGKFDDDSDLELDMLMARRSATARMLKDSRLSFTVALAEVLQDIAARKSNPAARTRGALFDWSFERACEDMRARLKVEGVEVGRKRPRSVPEHEYEMPSIKRLPRSQIPKHRLIAA